MGSDIGRTCETMRFFASCLAGRKMVESLLLEEVNEGEKVIG